MAIVQSSGISVPAAVSDLVVSHVGFFDSYIIIPTGNNDYTALIKDGLDHHVTQLRVYRGSGYGDNTWHTSLSDGVFEYRVSEEYYIVSNVGIGTYKVPPVYQVTESMCITAVTVFIGLAILFKGIIFKWFRRDSR